MGKRGFCFTAGPLIMILGGFPLLYIHTVASMMRPEIRGWDYWSEVFSRMFDFSNEIGWTCAMSIGVFLIGAGFFVIGMFDVVMGGLRWLSKVCH
jgi:hypothetical protein